MSHITKRHFESIDPAREKSLPFVPYYIECLIDDRQGIGESVILGEVILRQIAIALGLSPDLITENYPSE